jgi:hypothetical protein
MPPHFFETLLIISAYEKISRYCRLRLPVFFLNIIARNNAGWKEDLREIWNEPMPGDFLQVRDFQNR